MRDIVATIQGEQDAIIRSELPGVLVVQGGPGTGKTAVALHRAAYLLYTHRFPLERQGVLVIGPNPLFLRYIEKVLPSLGESGVTLSTISGLVHGFQDQGRRRSGGREAERRRPDGEGDRHGPCGVASARSRPDRRDPVRVGGAAPDDRADAAGRFRRHAGGRGRTTHDGGSWSRSSSGAWPTSTSGPEKGSMDRLGGGGAEVEEAVDWGEVEEQAQEEFDLADFGRQIRGVEQFREVLDRIWPRLSAEELLHDLFGARPLLAAAAKGILSAAEQDLLCTEAQSLTGGGPVHGRRRGPGGRSTCGTRRKKHQKGNLGGPGAAGGRREPAEPTATSSSTRHRTSLRCSYGWWRADRSPGR